MNFGNLLASLLWQAFFPSNGEKTLSNNNFAAASSPGALPFGICDNGSPEAAPASTGNATTPPQFCLFGQTEGSNIIFTIHSNAIGWSSIGISPTESMINATVFVIWPNSTQGWTISDRISTDHVMPILSNNSVSQIVPLRVPSPAWAKMAYSFSRPLVNVDVEINAQSAFIYASGKKAPLGSIDSPASNFRGHNLKGSFGVLDFIGGGGGGSTSATVAPSSTVTTATTTTVAPTTTPGLNDGSGTCIPNLFCLLGEPDASGKNVIFTMHAAAGGWAAVGTGDDMSDSYMTIGWKNSTGGYTITDRYSNDTKPPVSDAGGSVVVPLHVPAPAWANISFSFIRPINPPSGLVLNHTTHYVFAYSSRLPATPDSTTSTFHIHDKLGKGHLGPIDFITKGTGTLVPPPVITAPPPPPPPAVNPSAGNTTSVCVPNLYCVYGEPDPKIKGNVLITLHSAMGGWAALGVGSSMAASKMIIGWKSSSGGYVITDRSSSGHDLPAAESSSPSTLVALAHPAPAWASLAFTFTRPFVAADVTINPASIFIYAYAKKGASSPDSASSAFSIHDGFGVLGNLDFTTAEGGGGGTIAPGGSGGSGGGGSNGPNKGAVGAGLGSTCIPGIFCVYSEPDGKGNTYITLMAAAKGWVGLGTGTSMDSSSMIVGWQNSHGGFTISDRTSTTSDLPVVAAQVESSVVPLRVTKPSWANLAFTVLKPIAGKDVTFTAQTEFIYAYSSTPPSNPDSAGSSFSIHTGRGQLGILDFTTAHTGTGSTSTNGPGGNGTSSGGGNGGASPVPIGSSNGLVGSTCIPNTYCVYSLPDGNGNVQITLHSSASSWMALGTGTAMAGSFMIIAWPNSTGGYTISDRLASGELQPNPSTFPASSVVPLLVPAPSWAKLAVSFVRPLTSKDYTFSTTSNFIYAVSSSSAISSPDISTSSFPIHDKYGSLGNLDFTTVHTGVGSSDGSAGGSTGIVALPAGVDYSTIIRIHGYVMIYAWLLCPFIGIFIARYLKDKLGIWWFRLHVAVMVLGTALGCFASILLIFLFKSTSTGHFASSTSLHPLLGLLIFIALILQIILGIVSDKMWSPTRTAIPWWDKAHWWLGRVACLGALVNIITGIVFTDNFGAYATALVVLSVLCGLFGIGLFVYGEMRLGVVHHMKKPASNPLGPSDAEEEEGIIGAAAGIHENGNISSDDGTEEEVENVEDPRDKLEIATASPPKKTIPTYSGTGGN